MNMNDVVQFAVVGCGKIGARHLEVLRNQVRAKTIAICDSDVGKCHRLSALYTGIPCFTDYIKMLNTVDADVVSICTPHNLHAPMAIIAANSGRHVLVEKPMALTSRDAEAMIAAAERNRVRLMVVKQNRHNVPIKMAKSALDGGKLGRVFMVQCNVLWNRYDRYYTDSDWRGRKALEGGALFTQVSHFIDLMIWWFGDMVRAKADISTKKQSIETEDCGIAQVQFASGVMGAIVWTTCAYRKNYEGSLTLIGEKGLIKIGGEYLNRIEHWDVDGYPLPEDVDFTDKPNSYGEYQGTSSNHDKVIDDIVNDLTKNERLTVDGYEGVRTVKAIELIYDAADKV